MLLPHSLNYVSTHRDIKTRSASLPRKRFNALPIVPSVRMRSTVRMTLVSAWVLGLLGILARGQEPESSTLEPGLVALFRALDGTATIARTEPLPRLFGEPGDSVHPGIAPAGFEATWTGLLDVPEDGAYVFSLEPSSLSQARLSLNRREIPLGTAIELEYGQAPFELRGLHLQGAPAVELFWESAQFATELIPPWAFRHVPDMEGAAVKKEGELLDRGAVLAEACGCFRCHEGPERWAGSLARGLDLKHLLPGPRLDRTADRLRRAWVEAWLRSPQSLRPGTAMPALFGKGASDEKAIQTIAAYLAGGQGEAAPETHPPGDAKRGREIYQALACGACH